MQDAILSAFLVGSVRPLTEPEKRDLLPLLRECLRRGAAAWPELHVSEADFARHLGRAVAGQNRDLAEALRTLHAEDLFLACACLHRVPRALAIFDSLYLAGIDRWQPLAEAGAAVVDEIRQILRNKLFLPSAEGAPKIASFSGCGSLASWVAVVARRTALSMIRRDKRQQRDIADEMGLVASAGLCDPEIEYLRDRYRSDLREAFRNGFCKLSQRDRLILRLNLMEGLTLEKIGVIYGVHQSTVSRWVQAARESMKDEVHRFLAEHLLIDPSDVGSLIRLLPSALDLSLAGTTSTHEMSADS